MLMLHGHEHCGVNVTCREHMVLMLHGHEHYGVNVTCREHMVLMLHIYIYIYV